MPVHTGISLIGGPKCPETPIKRDTRLKNEIGRNLRQIICAAAHMLHYHGVHNDYSQLCYFWELIRVTVTVTVIIFPVITCTTVMSPLQL